MSNNQNNNWLNNPNNPNEKKGGEQFLDLDNEFPQQTLSGFPYPTAPSPFFRTFERDELPPNNNQQDQQPNR
jgi:hypothetical protein